MKSYDKEKIVFLDALNKGHTVADAAKATGVPRRTWYDVRDREPAFREAWDYARTEAREHLLGLAEAVLKTRALDPEDRYGHQLLMFLLKRLDPEYRENFKREVTHKHEKVLEIEFSEEDMDKAIQVLTEARKGKTPSDEILASPHEHEDS